MNTLRAPAQSIVGCDQVGGADCHDVGRGTELEAAVRVESEWRKRDRNRQVTNRPGIKWSNLEQIGSGSSERVQ